MSSASLEHSAGFDFPSIGLPVFDARGRSAGIAVAVSLLIHGAALGWLPGFHATKNQLPQLLKIRLVEPAVQPEPVAVPPAPTFARAPSSIRREAPPVPWREEPPPTQYDERPQLLKTDSVAAPKQEAQPSRAVAPVAAASKEAPQPVPTPGPVRPATLDAGMLAAYGRELAGAVATRQRYPRIALLRQWQGTAVLQLELSPDGRLLSARVLSSSGHDTLDRQALEMVREAVPLTRLPADLAWRSLTIDVPVVFRITS